MAMGGAKHTAGPWRVFTSTSGFRLIGIGELNGTGVADCGFGVWRGGSEEAMANARLIAAAPDLLEALEALRLQALQSDVNNPANEWGREALAMAHAAINKARGVS